MYERFTDRARKVMQLANQEAQRFNHEYIGTEHILLGLVKEGSGVAANVLQNLEVDLRRIRLEVEKIVQAGPDEVTMGKLPQTPRAKKVCEYAVEEARTLAHNYVGTEHLLLGVLREEEGVGAQVLMNLGVGLEQVRQEVLSLLGHGADSSPPSKASGSRRKTTDREELRDLPRQAQEAIRELDVRLEALQRAKEEAVAAEDFEKAACLKEDAHALQRQREEVLRAWRGRKTERIWEYDASLALTDANVGIRGELERVRQRLLEVFGGFVELSQHVHGAWQVGQTSLSGNQIVFRVTNRDVGQAMVFFSKLREELRESGWVGELVVLSRKVEVL